jgi:hypothetical protein
MAKANSKTVNTKVIYDALVVRQYTDKATGEERNQWNNVGVAFPHKDGEGFNIQLDALPVGGDLVLRLRKPRAD